MGCDIHAAIEYKNSDGKWHCASKRPNKYYGKWDGESEFRYDLDLDRDYDMFAMLGNVRNGAGFAGCDTGDGFDYMSDSRGVPEDAAPDTLKALSNEHSATWVTLSEILAFDWTRTTKHRGWVNAVTFEKWDRLKEWNPQPDEWCGGISGGSVEHVSEQEMRRKVKSIVGDKRGTDFDKAIEQIKARYGNTYCLIEWENSYSSAGRQIWEKILPPMLKLAAEHGFDNVRIVMDFDS